MSTALVLPLCEVVTLAANRELSLACFGEEPEAIAARLSQPMDDLKSTSVTTLPVMWRMEIYDVTDFNSYNSSYSWLALKIQAIEAELKLGTMPLSIESHLITQRLFGVSGTSAILVPAMLPYAGGLIVKGKFLSKPNIRILRPEKCVPNIVAIPKLYQSGEAGECELMYGYAMNSKLKQWRPRTWLISSSGEVIDMDAENDHFFGVRITGDAADTFARIYLQGHAE